MLIEENKPLAPFTSFGIGGPARFFVEVRSEDDIEEATAWAQTRHLTPFVLGGGSNLLVSDAGFDGLVVRVGLRGIALAGIDEHMGRMIYRAAAGEDWDDLVERAVRNGCAGIECLAGIPGTVGGTPVQNVGAYGQEVSSVIERVRVFDLTERTFQELTAQECEFGYRRSRFNTTDRGRYIVTRVDFRLTPDGPPTLRYADIQRAFLQGAQPSLAEVAAVVRNIRRGKGMLLVEGDQDCHSAGSFFKNPVVTKEQAQRIGLKTGREAPLFPTGPGSETAGLVKVPAAWLIEHAGFARGYGMGRAAISSRHTLAIVNRGGASAREILALAAEVIQAVEGRFGIRLEMEPVMVGF